MSEWEQGGEENEGLGRPPRELVIALEALQALKQITGCEPHVVISMGGDSTEIIATSNKIDKQTGMRMIISLMKATGICAEEVDVADRQLKRNHLPTELHEYNNEEEKEEEKNEKDG